jgi:hypothetical protein
MSREWVKPGAKVAVWVSSGWGGRGNVTHYDEIDRVLKRDIVLKGGRRFYFRNDYSQEAIEKGTARSYRTDYLYPIDHIKVRDYETGQQESASRSNVERIYDAWRRQPTVDAAGTLIRAVEAWVALQPQGVSS